MPAELFVAMATAVLASVTSIIVAFINVSANKRAKERAAEAEERELRLNEYQMKLESLERERMEAQRKHEEEQRKRFGIMELGIQNLLRNEIIKMHARCIEQGWASLEDKEFMERNYVVYHDMEGNGIGTKLHAEVMNLPTKGKGSSLR